MKYRGIGFFADGYVDLMWVVDGDSDELPIGWLVSKFYA